MKKQKLQIADWDTSKDIQFKKIWVLQVVDPNTLIHGMLGGCAKQHVYERRVTHEVT